MKKYIWMEINMDRNGHNGQDWQNEQKCIKRIENGHIVQKWTEYIALIIGQNWRMDRNGQTHNQSTINKSISNSWGLVE